MVPGKGESGWRSLRAALYAARPLRNGHCEDGGKATDLAGQDSFALGTRRLPDD